MAQAPGTDVVNLLFIGLSSKSNAQNIESYISAKVDDDDVEVVKVNMLGDGKAIATVKGITDVDNFISQRHKIGGQQVELSITEPPTDPATNINDNTDELDESRIDIIPNQVEVTCSTGSVDEEILEMYFSGKKSGGKKEKEIESVEEIGEGVYCITYQSEKDAALVVAQTRHVCGKMNFTVRYVPAPIPKEYDKDKLIIKEIPDGVDEEFFVTFIESKLGIENDEDFQIDFRKTCAIIMLTEERTDEELDEMVKKLAKKKIKKQNLVIERCEVNCCIVFANIKETFANEDALEMYLEQKKSGAGDEMVESIEMLGSNSAKVTFVSPAVVSQVLHSMTNHKKKLGAEVTLTVCTPLDSLDQLSTIDDEESADDSSSSCSDDGDKKKKVVKKPKQSTEGENITGKSAKKKKRKKKAKGSSSSDEETDSDASKQNILHAPVIYLLDPMIAKYLKSTPSVIQELSKEVEVSIAIDEKAGNVTLSQNEFSPQNWPAVVAEKWEHSLSDLVYKTDIHVPSEGATEIYPIIMSNSAKEGLQYAFGKGDNKVCLVGNADIVKKLESDIEELCSRMIKKSEAIKLSEEDYAFLKGVTLTAMQTDHHSIQFKCVDLDHSLSANGSLHDVGILKQSLPKYISHSRLQVSLHPMATEFLRVGKGGPDVLRTLLGTTKCVPYYVENMPGYVLFLLYAKHDTYTAESLAKTVSSCIKVEPLALPKSFASSIVTSPKYANFKENLMKKFPHISPIQQDGTLLVVASTNVFASVKQGYNHFINDECSTVESVRFRKGAWRLLQTTSAMRMWSDLTSELKKIDVLIVFCSKPSAQRPFVKIKGMTESIELAKEKISALQKSIVERDIPIARPGVCNYFFKDPNGQMILKGVENEANVCIEMDVKDHSGAANTSTGGGAPEFLKVCFGNTNEMKLVNVYVGDITEFNRAEVIVNAANENLKHAGGVAQAIEAKGGAQIRRDSENHIKTYGKVKTGHAVLIPRVGNLPLPYKAIVHTVGPTWVKKNQSERALLRKAVQESLVLAKDYSSIAIPAISGGIYGFPPDVCAEVLMEAVKRFSQDTGMCSLNEINFVVFQNNVETFISAAKKAFVNIRCHSDTVPDMPSTNITPKTQTGRRRRRAASITPVPVANVPTPSNNQPQPPQNTSTSASGWNKTYQASVTKKIQITQGDILKHLEDVIVNTTDEKFSFNGFVAKALKKGAGLGLEEECEATPTPIPKGSVITTGAHGLNASYIHHIVLPSHSEPNSIKILSDVIVKCLEETNRLGMKSISIPSVGAGNLGYPGDEVAKCLLQTTADYISKNQHKSLSLVHFVVFEKSIYHKFKAQYSALSAGGTSQEAYHQPSQPAAFTGNCQSCNFTLPNNLRLEVVQGDITDASVNVIVNTTNSNLKLVGGGVAGALAKKAGPDLQIACNKIVRQGIKLTEGNVIDTPCANMGSLLCKSIFHIVFESRNLSKLEQTIYACLDRAEKMQFSSIAFPAIGTGLTNIPPQEAVNAFVNALKKFMSKKTPRYVSVIRMVLFQQQHYSQFVDAFKKMESNSGGFLRKVINAVGSYLGYRDDDEEEVQDMEVDNQGGGGETEDPDEWDDLGGGVEQNMFANLSKTAEVIITIYGESQQCVGRAEKKLRAIIDTQFIDEEINHEDVSYLSDSSAAMLEEFANTHQVDIDIERDLDLHFISLHGCSGDVLLVKDKVRDVLSSFGANKVMKEAAEAMAKHIRWVRIFDDDTEEYDGVFTYEIESAFQRKDKKYISSDKDENFEINFSTMEEIDLVTGDKVKVKRMDLLQEEKPTNWDPMPTDSTGKEVEAHCVDLQPGSQEYVEMEQRFNTAMRKGQDYKDIVSIQRIQNPILYGQYVARKREMDKRNPPNCTNERLLFHGTVPDAVNAITTQGFNRSFSGKNAVVYGQGAYFARDATYSNRDTYSRPDANGVKNMYIARVLIGEYTLGNSNMIVPPPKNPQLNKHVLFDSTVDNMASPSIYVVYGDSQSYPAYLIKYKKN